MPFLLSRWKLHTHFYSPVLSVCEVFISGRSSAVRSVMFTCRVTSLITCIQFWLFIKEYLTTYTNFAMTGGQWSFLSILAKTTWFYCKRLQSHGPLKFVQFFLDHSVLSKIKKISSSFSSAGYMCSQVMFPILKSQTYWLAVWTTSSLVTDYV